MKRIALTQGQFAVVDDEDFERANQHKWRFGLIHGMRYALREVRRDGKRTTEYLHRFILQAERTDDVDHRDGDGLNNTRENLRICSHSQNMANRRMQRNNSSGFKGITRRGDGKWAVSVGCKNAGTYDSAVAAALAYDSVATNRYGEFALTNQKLGLL